MHDTLFFRYWNAAISELDIRACILPKIEMKDGSMVEASILLPQFGAKRGMLLFSDYEIVAPYYIELSTLGYGISIIEDPLPGEVFELSNYIELLKDWGWSNHGRPQPDWLAE
tara:strand:+ start:164 stop:502 length:339 start_codon:yes stop_codon:yes gene_type:complete